MSMHACCVTLLNMTSFSFLVPGDVVGFNVEVLRMEKIFQLTWQVRTGILL